MDIPTRTTHYIKVHIFALGKQHLNKPTQSLQTQTNAFTIQQHTNTSIKRGWYLCVLIM